MRVRFALIHIRRQYRFAVVNRGFREPAVPLKAGRETPRSLSYITVSGHFSVVVYIFSGIQAGRPARAAACLGCIAMLMSCLRVT